MFDKENVNQLMEAYILGNLPSQDKAAFELELANDPLLKNEYMLQAQIISSLQSNRRMELKDRLKNIEVGTGNSGTNFTLYKYIGLGIVAAALVVTSYFYFGSEKQAATTTLPEVHQQANAVDNEELVSKADAANGHKSEPTSTQTAINNSLAGQVQKESKAVQFGSVKKKDAVSKGETTNKAFDTVADKLQVNPPSVKLDDDNQVGDIKKESNIKMPSGKIASVVQSNAANTDISVDKTTNHKHHYQYYNNKLFLYGDFDGALYELIEYNTSKGKKLYMYYQEAFYQIKDNQFEITKLVDIQDKALLNELNALRKKKVE